LQLAEKVNLSLRPAPKTRQNISSGDACGAERIQGSAYIPTAACPGIGLLVCLNFESPNPWALSTTADTPSANPHQTVLSYICVRFQSARHRGQMTPYGFESGQRPRAAAPCFPSSTAHPSFVSQARWLLWLVGRSNGTLLAVQQQCFAIQVFRKSVGHRAMLNPESIRATRGLWPAARYCILVALLPL